MVGHSRLVLYIWGLGRLEEGEGKSQILQPLQMQKEIHGPIQVLQQKSETFTVAVALHEIERDPVLLPPLSIKLLCQPGTQ